MNSSKPGKSQDPEKKILDIRNLLGSCTGSAIGCGLAFLSSSVVGWLIALLLAPAFGAAGGGNTAVGVLLAALKCGGSLILAAVLSFLAGRLFPSFQKAAR
jgi:hypothetical protein